MTTIEEITKKIEDEISNGIDCNLESLSNYLQEGLKVLSDSIPQLLQEAHDRGYNKRKNEDK